MHGKFLECVPEPAHECVIESAADADDHVIPREIRSVEFFDMIEGDRLDALDKADFGMGVRRTFEDHLVKRLLAEGFVVRVSERFLDKIQSIALDAIEVLLLERGVQDCLREELKIIFQIVLVNASADDGHFLVHRAVVTGRHRVQFFQDFVIAVLLRTPVGQHEGGQGSQSFLSRGIVLGSNLEPDAE